MVKPIHLREEDFKNSLKPFTYPEKMKTEFFEYWSEPNKSGTKMRFELERTWHLSRRLARWANNGFGTKDKPVMSLKMPIKAPETEIEKLDDLLTRYKAKFESVTDEEMVKWYDYLKSQKLMRIFSKEDIELIKASYPNDNLKCRATCVRMTLDGYVNSNLTFGHIMEIRNRLSV